MEYEVNGGVNTITGDVEWLEAHGGVLYVKGKVGTLVHHGGVMYDQRQSNRVEYRTDRMSEEERWRFRQRIAELERRLNRSELECLKLRDKIGKEEAETPPDDVLVMRIESLEAQLERERKAHRIEVEELKERIDVALEINAKLRNRPATDNGRSQEIADNHIDILATLMAAYPFTPDKDLEFEFGIPSYRIRDTARMLGQIKSPEARAEAREYLQKQHRELIQRRGGDQGNHKPRTRQVEKVDKKGKVLASYKSIVDAANRTGCTSKTIQKYCLSEKTIYMKDGITFRYKDNENQNS